jgi:hypothetical protein
MVPPAAVVMIRGKLKAPTLQAQTVSEVWALFTSKVWGKFCKYSGTQPGRICKPEKKDGVGVISKLWRPPITTVLVSVV